MTLRLGGYLTINAFLTAAVHAAIGMSGVADKAEYHDSVTITVTADPGAVIATAKLDGEPFAVGSPMVVNSVRFHELAVEGRDAKNAPVDSRTRRFIIKDSTRGGTEDGIPPSLSLPQCQRRVVVDQKAIGRTPRSNLTTHTGQFDHGDEREVAAAPGMRQGLQARNKTGE